MLTYCCLCGKKLVPFRTRVDWDDRRSHKICYRQWRLNCSQASIIPDELKGIMTKYDRYNANTGEIIK